MFIYFILFTFSFSQETTEISSTPLKTDVVKTQKISKIVEDIDGFYESISIQISPDNKVVVLDHGNHLIHIFNYPLINNFSEAFAFALSCLGNHQGIVSNGPAFF